MSKAQPPSGATDPADEAGTIARERAGDGSAASGVNVRNEPGAGELQETLPRMLAGRYRLEQLIAKGGMGRVYLATQLPLGRRVAVKVLRVNVDEELGRRFFLEASICAKLQHRHIVTVHDYGETDDGELFMVMEYLDGEPLSVSLARARIPALHVIDIMLQVARALRAAHREGTVHRDLKPGNIMLLRDVEHGEDMVKVVDFGLVKVFQATSDHAPESELTRAGSLLGSPRYMAPEQILGETVDARTDVYSFGVVLFTLLTGRAPFVGGPRGTVEVLNQHLRDPVPRLREVIGDDSIGPAEASLQAIVDRCMQKSAMDRYPSMDEVIVDLRNALVLAGGASALDSMSLSRELAVSGAFRVPTIRPSSKPPSAEAVTAVEAPALAPVATASASFEVPERATGSRNAKLAVLGVAVLVGLAAGIFALTRRGDAPRGDGATAAQPSTTDAPSAPATPAEDVSVRLGSSPAGAEVYLDGQRLGTTPLVHRTTRLPAGETRRFVFRLPGHVETSVVAQLDRDSVDVMAALVAAPPSAPPAAATAAASPPGEPEVSSPVTAAVTLPSQARGPRVHRGGGHPAGPARSSVTPTAAPPPPLAIPAPPRPEPPPRRPTLPSGVRVVDDQPGRRVPVVD